MEKLVIVGHGHLPSSTVENLTNRLEAQGVKVVIADNESMRDQGIQINEPIIYHARPQIPDIYVEPIRKGRYDNRPWYDRFDKKRKHK